jgi:hypothetical protein
MSQRMREASRQHQPVLDGNPDNSGVLVLREHGEVQPDLQQNGDRRTDLANHGVVVLAPASTGVALPWRCNMVTNTTAYRPTIAE